MKCGWPHRRASMGDEGGGRAFRGLVFGLVFSVPVWLAIGGIVWAVLMVAGVVR